MLFLRSLLCALAHSSLLGHAAARQDRISRRSISVYQPNFLDYISCKEQPEGTCTLALMLTPDGDDMGALIFDHECTKVVGIAHSIHWDEKTALSPGAWSGFIVEPRKHGKSVYWLDGDESGDDVDWDHQEWYGHSMWSEQTTFLCGEDRSG